jgi:hypothetical protein
VTAGRNVARATRRRERAHGRVELPAPRSGRWRRCRSSMSARLRQRRPRDSTARTRSWIAWCNGSSRFIRTRRLPRPPCARGSAIGNASSWRETTTPPISGPRARRALHRARVQGHRTIADKMNDWILEQGTRTNTCNTDALQAEGRQRAPQVRDRTSSERLA